MVKKKTSKKVIEKKEEPKKSNSLKINYWMIASVVLVIVLSIVLIANSTSGISKKKAESIVLTFLTERYGLDSEDIQFNSIISKGDIFIVEFLVQGDEGEFAVSKDGKYFGQMIESSSFMGGSITGNVVDTPTWTIPECSSENEVREDVVFFYSDSCGWCARMKPGIASLVERGYKIYSANAAERDSFIEGCIIPHMTSGGVPQFICLKTGEIKVGAFTDLDQNLDQEAMDAWVDACVNS